MMSQFYAKLLSTTRIFIFPLLFLINSAVTFAQPPPPQPFSIVISNTCNSATAVITTNGITPVNFSFIWTDGENNIVGQTINSPDTVNTVSNLADSAAYSLQVFWTDNGDTILVLDTVRIFCGLEHSADTIVCSGQAVTLWAHGIGSTGTYSWLPGGAINDTITVTPDTTTSYTVMFTPTIGGGPYMAAITVTAIANPSVTINDTAICAGQTATLTAVSSVAGGTYIWWPGGDTTQSISITPQNTTHYIVTYTTSCYVATDTNTVTVNNALAPVLTVSTDTICSGDSAYICAPSGYVSYNWTGGSTNTCTYAFQPGNYYVTVTDNGNCTATSNAIAIHSYPATYISIISNGDTLYTTLGFTNYQWYLNTDLLEGANTNIYIVNQPGNYNFSAIDSNGCYAISSTVVIAGINETDIDKWIKVFPNPSSGRWILEIDNNLIGGVVEIFDANGKLVYTHEILNAQSEILLDESMGVYTLHLVSKLKSFNLKLIKI